MFKILQSIDILPKEAQMKIWFWTQPYPQKQMNEQKSLTRYSQRWEAQTSWRNLGRVLGSAGHARSSDTRYDWIIKGIVIILMTIISIVIVIVIIIMIITVIKLRYQVPLLDRHNLKDHHKHLHCESHYDEHTSSWSLCSTWTTWSLSGRRRTTRWERNSQNMSDGVRCLIRVRYVLIAFESLLDMLNGVRYVIRAR